MENSSTGYFIKSSSPRERQPMFSSSWSVLRKYTIYTPEVFALKFEMCHGHLLSSLNEYRLDGKFGRLVSTGETKCWRIFNLADVNLATPLGRCMRAGIIIIDRGGSGLLDRARFHVHRSIMASKLAVETVCESIVFLKAHELQS